MDYKLNEICDVIDCPHSTAIDEGVGHPLIRTPNVGKGRLILNGVHRVSDEIYEIRTKRGVPENGDLILAREAPIGNVAVIKTNEKVCLGQRTVLLKPDKSKVNPDYLAYYLLAPEQQYKLTGGANGATVAHVNVSAIRDMEISIPSLEEQQKIASYLSVYDDLIENNQKRMRLLEESCRLYYSSFQFEKYAICTLFDFDCRIESGRRPAGGIDTSIKDGVPSVGAENVIGLGKYNFNSEKYITTGFYDKMKTGKIQNKDILIYKDGAYIGKTSLFQDGFPHNQAAVNEHVFLLHANDDVYQYYLFFTLSQKQYYMKMQNLNSNAAQPGLNQRALFSLELPLPPIAKIHDFNDFVLPIVSEIFKLAKQNKLLVEQRDLLMSRVFSESLEM